MKVTNLKAFYEAKIEGEMEILSELLQNQPTRGEIRVQWYQDALADGDGEFVTIERWNGFAWEQHGLDVDATVGDLLDLNQKFMEEENDCF